MSIPLPGWIRAAHPFVSKPHEPNGHITQIPLSAPVPRFRRRSPLNGTTSTCVAWSKRGGQVMSQHWVSNISGLMDVAVDRSPLEESGNTETGGMGQNLEFQHHG